ncbi:MAG: chitobiase/beta-hexosaminidase C-terminal domain-containing protein, partial [Fibrobacterales bacterium]
MRIQLNKTLTLVLFTVFVTITGCFLDSDSKRSRDYSISIEANKAIPIDRIEVMYSVGDDTTFISYDNESIGHTSIDSASDKHSVLFTLTGDKSDQTIIDYTWYSNGIAILSNRNEFVLAGNVRPQSAVIDSAMVDLLIMYHTNKMVQNENSSDPIHQQTVYTHNSALFSSLVASNLVGADSSEANNLYRAYKTHQINIYGLQTPPDTLRVLSQSRDSLDHYGYPFSELLGYLFPETETFDDLIAALPQTVNIPVNDTTTVIDLPMAALFSITGSISAHAEETEYITVVIIDTNSFDSVRLEATKGTLDYSTTWRKVAPQAYRVEVQFYSSDSIQTGVVSAQFDSTQLTVILPGVDAWNGKPTIALSALDTLSINDQFVFTVKGIDTLNGVIDSSQVKIGENNWITVTPSDTLFNAPATQIDSLWVYGRVIDSEGNVVVDSSLTTVVLDLPVLTVKVVDTLIDLSDSVRISWVGSDEFGSIINYSVRPLENATDMDWIDAGLEKGISFNHASSDGYIQYIVRATDDDSQMVYDTVSVHKIIDPPVATSVSISGSAEQNGSLVVSYFYSDLLGDAEGTSFFQWFRGNDTIAGAITNTYTPIYSDNGAVLSCIVTPVALTGYTKIGEGIMAQFANQVTGFTAPVVSNITIIGTATFESTLRVSYNYNDAEGDTEGASQFQWLRGGTLIAGANSVEYQVTESDVGESLSVQVQPVALTGDVLSGTPVESEGVLAEGTLPSPVIETLGGTFAEDQLVTIVTSVENGTIHYTIDGAKPTELSPTYTGSISVSSTVILYASVFKNGWNNSVASVETYIINGSTSPPIISEDNRENATAFDITAFAGEGLIYVTQSTGTPDEPDESSTVVNGPISVDRTMNYKFKVFRTGFRPSITVSRSYVVNGQADAPQVTPSRNEATGFLVTASGIGTIYYTTDGSDPTDASDVWVDRSVTITGTYNFRIYRNLYLPSDVVTETYTINGQLEAPSVSLSNGIYNSIQTITVSEPNGSEVFYTINGTEPTKSSTSIAGTITVDGSATYQFKAFKDNWVSSQLTIRTYAMEIEEPSVVPDANHATEIVVSAQKSVGTIYYTSGVTSTIPEPTSSIGTLYSGEIRVQSSVYYKFKEFRNDWRSSPTALRHYVINGTTSFASLSNDAEHASSISVTASGTGTIYYSTTTNGSEPPTPIISSSWVWSNRTITRVGTTRYKYLLRRSGYVDNIQSRTFTINGPAPYSNISVGGSAESSIVVTAAAPGSIIYFSSTTNGSEPGTPSTSSVWSNRTISGTGTH